MVAQRDKRTYGNQLEQLQIADYARVTIVSAVRPAPRRSSGSGCPSTQRNVRLRRGVIRWNIQVTAYTLTLVTDRYPPFRLAP